MKNTFKKLLAYSTSANAFLLLAPNANGQILYHNIDPDTLLQGTYIDDLNDSLNVDFNGDGVTDIQIRYNATIEWYVVGELETNAYGIMTASIKQFNAVIKNTDYPVLYGADNLASGFSINNYGQWNDLDSIRLFYFNQYYSSIPYENWFEENQYLGVKFMIGPEMHYGWIRLSITNYGITGRSPIVAVQDFAYEMTPNTPLIIANPTASIAEHIFMTDEFDYQNAADFIVQFNKAIDESTVSAYRIFLYKYQYPSLTPPSVALLETLPPELYFEVIPSGSPTYEIMLPASLTDINGNPILTGYPNYYKAIILSVADGVLAAENNASLPSINVVDELTKVEGPNNLTINKPTENCDITDFIITFHKANDESYIAEYRVYILNDDHGIISENNPSYYVSVIPESTDNYSVTPTADKLVFEDTIPILFQNYYAEIMTIGDSIHATIANFNYTRYDQTYYGGPIGDEEEFYCEHYDHTPVISFIDTTKTPADIQVQFNGPGKISGVSEYRIFIVPEAELADFTVSKAEDIPFMNYFKITEPVTDLNIILPANLPDINGDTVTLEKRYAIIVAVLDTNIPAKIAISSPSEVFNFISDEGNLPLPYSYIYNDVLYVFSKDDLPYNLIMYNMAGVPVMTYEITSALTLIDLSDFPKGTYIIKSKSVVGLPVTKVFIGHAGY